MPAAIAIPFGSSCSDPLHARVLKARLLRYTRPTSPLSGPVIAGAAALATRADLASKTNLDLCQRLQIAFGRPSGHPEGILRLAGSFAASGFEESEKGVDMKRLSQLTTIALVLACSAGTSWPDSEVRIFGQVRFRSEADKRDFSPGATVKSFSDLRTRASVEATVDGNTSALIQLQDSRRLGGQSLFGTDNSGTLSNGANIDIHQAVVSIDHLWQDGPGLRAGRFEVNLGNQRVFGSVGWHNVGRSWEGAILSLRRPALAAEAYWLKSRELNDSVGNRDFDLLAVTADVPSLGLQFVGFYETNADRIAGTDTTQVNALDRYNVGAYTRHQSGRLSFESNGLYQFGKQRQKTAGGYRHQDISAFLLALETRLDIEPNLNAWIAMGLDYASGDKNPDDDTYQAYHNLYYTGHKFRGHMDYFVESRPEGLIDVMARGGLAPVDGWTVGMDAHYFSSAAEYVDQDGERSRSIGAEVDVFVSTTRVAGARLQSGISLFLSTKSFAGPDVDPGMWGYFMVTSDFGTKR